MSRPYTVTRLARRCGVSRTTLLYYEQEGLLQPSRRGANGYRYFDEDAVEHVKRIRAYRDYGLPLTEIRALLAEPRRHTDVLQQHFMRLEGEIHRLRKQQQAIVALLEERSEPTVAPLSKERWVAIMRSAGLSDAEMRRWHQEFERLEPVGHAAFLASIGCTQSEVADIRRWSASGDVSEAEND